MRTQGLIAVCYRSVNQGVARRPRGLHGVAFAPAAAVDRMLAGWQGRDSKDSP